MEKLWSRSEAAIPASYWVASAAGALVVLVCYATQWWVPWFAADFGVHTFEPAFALNLAPALVVVFGCLVGLLLASGAFLALRWPWFALGLVLLPGLPSLVDATPVPFGIFAGLAAVTLGSSWRRPVASAVATGAGLVVLAAWLASGQQMAAPFRARIDIDYYAAGRLTVLGVAYGLALLAVLAAGLGIRHAALRDQERQALVARSGEVEEQAAVVGERARLARDLHDVVAHHISLIAVRAETAPYTHPDLAQNARGVLGEIAADARLALDELRGVLGILGRAADPAGGAAARAPQPSWGDIAALVERSRSAGADVHLEGDVAADVGATEGYVAYRVVQEALTNARKHAPGEPARVQLEATGGLLVARVSTSGRSGDRPDVDTAPGTTGGMGLVGMRERVEAIGGRLVTGRRGDEFVVEATLPRAAA